MEKEKFEMFAALLENEKVHMFSGVTFSVMCGWVGAGIREMDAFLKSEFGYGGDEILEAYRRSTSSRLREKYGIEL